MDKSISQFREVTNVYGNEYLLLTYPNIRNSKIKVKNFLQNYYDKSEINNIIQNVSLRFKVVDELPQIGEKGIIYLVPTKEIKLYTIENDTLFYDTKPLSNIEEYNIREEYIWIDNKWELLGTTKIDLADYATKEEVNQSLDNKLDIQIYDLDKLTFALKTDISDMLTTTKAAQLYQPKGDYLTSIPDEYVTESELDDKNYATQSQLNSAISDKITKEQADEYYQSIGDYALTNEIPTKVSQLTNDSGYLNNIPSEYVTENELNSKSYATVTQLNTKQDTLQSGTNIKTINGQSILGNGNIEIKSGGEDLSDKLIDILVTAGIIIDTRSINADTIFNATKVLMNNLQ